MKHTLLNSIILLSAAQSALGTSLSEQSSSQNKTVELAMGPKLEQMVITATREEQYLKDTDASVGQVGEDEIIDIQPLHVTDVFNRIAGVNVVQLGSTSEGVAAAIRQPISYGPVYLYLENGVPTRSPAFFNHNALYEVNVLGSSGIEVIKGPGSALYGSDGIGGVINILSGQPPKKDAASITLEAGEHGYYRGQVRYNKKYDTSGFTFKAAVNTNDGWRKHTSNSRESITTSYFTELGQQWTSNTVFTATHIDMDTGGSGLLYDDYINEPEQAGNLIGFREVNAYRLSSAFNKELENAHFEITPYIRVNDLAYMATWTLNSGREVFPRPWQCEPARPGVPCDVGVLDSQDAHINDSGHNSLGLQTKYRRNYANDKGFWIVGLDWDHSSGYTKHTYIERTDTSDGVYWLAYRSAGKLYDFDVDVSVVSPYIHSEYEITDKLRITGGLRFDDVNYDYENNLSDVTVDNVDDPSSVTHYRPADTSISMNHTSPKLGFTYDLSDDINAYVSYRHGFRIPSTGQLFRSGSTAESTSLEPVKADSYEIGIRGNLSSSVDFEVTAFTMEMEDRIVSLSDEETGLRRNENAAKTEHSGVELALGWNISNDWLLQASGTVTDHKYVEWVSRSGDFSGNTMPDAPENFANIVLKYSPDFLNDGFIELEWAHRGEHFIDENNYDDGRDTDRDTYPGHDLLNLRTNYKAQDNLEFYLHIYNLTDETYADTTSKWGPKYTPGRPRTAIFGVSYHFD